MQTYPDILTVEEVAEILKVTPQTVKNYSKRKVNPLPKMMLSSRILRFLKKDLLGWLKSQPDSRQDI